MLITIHHQILERTEALLAYVQPFLQEDVQSRYSECASDFNNLHKGILQLKNELLKLSFDTCILEDKDYSSYLSKIRRDLCNWVSVIKGYSELSIDCLEKNQDYALVGQLFIINRMTGEILNLINQIRLTPKMDETIANRTQSMISEETYVDEIIDSDYLEFKKQVSILIVDDLKEDCDILLRFLSRLGYQNISVEMDARKALKRLNESKVDLLLLELEMPGLNGVEMLLRLKEKIVKQHLSVLILSANDTIENIVDCIKIGAVDFLPKPFDSVMLRVRIESCVQKQWYVHHAALDQAQIACEKKRYEKLLHNIFPPAIVKELAETNQVRPRIYSDVAVLFTDVVGFTSFCETHSLNDISQGLQVYAEICERAAINHNMHKLKTVGDCFIGVSGLFTETENPVLDCVQCALEIMEGCKEMPGQWRVHSGIDFGSVIGGVVGHRQYLFDIWGDVVNTSARLLIVANTDKICLTSEAWKKVQEVYQGKFLGWHTFKGKDIGIGIYEVDFR